MPCSTVIYGKVDLLIRAEGNYSDFNPSRESHHAWNLKSKINSIVKQKTENRGRREDRGLIALKLFGRTQDRDRGQDDGSLAPRSE